MNRKLITLAFIAFTFGLGLSALPAEPGQEAGVEAVGAIEPAGKPCEDDFAQWAEKWGLASEDGESGVTGEGSRASIWLTYVGYKIKVNTMGGGGFKGSFIYEPGCYGGDIRGLFTAPGEFAMVFFNWERYDGFCGFLAKGPLDLPPPLSFTGINEIGFGTGTGMLELGSTGVWFHESVNDYLVQDWVAGPGWGVNATWDPSVTYDMVGTGAVDWHLTYYGARTYPRPAHDGFQYEACFRKNSGNPDNTVALYFNGDGTMNNGLIVVFDTVGAYAAFELIGNFSYQRIGPVFDEANLFQNDTALGGENVFNMVKVNVLDSGAFDVFLNQNYVASGQATNNFSGYVGLAVYDSASADHVSCDNMTLSTVPMLKGSIPDRKFLCDEKVVEPHTLLSPN